jgi:hypothetical protein
VHGRTTTAIDPNVSALRPPGDRNDARKRLRGLLRLQGLRQDVKTASRLLLRFLRLRFGSVPANPTGRGALLDSDIRAKVQRLARNTRSSLMAWWIPTALIVAGLPASTPLRTAVWVAALVWMGIACLLNARRSGRTHCRFTGPYYIAMVVPVLLLGSGAVDTPFYAWLVLAALILLGDKIIWWATERIWGTFSLPNSPRA